MLEAGTYLGKAIRDGQDGNLWMPMDSPYLKDLVEAFTQAGQVQVQSLRDALMSWLSVHGSPQQAPPLPILLMPSVPVQWTEKELKSWLSYFLSKPRVLWTPEDWSMLVEWLLQRYWSPKWAASMADWLTVKSTLLGQIEAGLAANPPSAATVVAMVAAVPASLDAAAAIGLTPSSMTHIMLAYARERCAQAIVDTGARMRSGIRDIVLDHQRAAAVGGKIENLEQRLFERFSTANRDWRRIAVTEVSENASQGVVSASAPGEKLKRVEQYKGVCAWCHKIDGSIVTVVDPSKPRKDGMTEIWPGKTNIGRSSAPRKIVGGRLYDREPDEMWWLAAGAQHPNCFVNSGVPIYTDKGNVPIRDIRVGDMVLTHKGRFMPVNWVSDRPKYTGDLVHATVSFNGKNSKQLPKMTPGHPVLTARGWINAGDLLTGDVMFALAKECPTCRTPFANLKHSAAVYCCNACIPKSGENQFSTNDAAARAVAIERTKAANVNRMAGLTIEQRRQLTAPARAAIAETGYRHLKNKADVVATKIAHGNASLNYTPRREELALVEALAVLGVPAETQYKIPRSWLDASNRRGWWFADIALPDQKIAIEVDGPYWHRDKARDERRDADIKSQGWDVIRVDIGFLMSGVGSVAEMIARRAMNHSGEYSFCSVTVDRVDRSTASPKTRLWNFGVEEDESYIAAGVVVHNCRGRWIPVTGVNPSKLSKFMAAVNENMAKNKAAMRDGS